MILNVNIERNLHLNIISKLSKSLNYYQNAIHQGVTLSRNNCVMWIIYTTSTADT